MTKETILNKISEQNNRDSWSLDNGMDYFDGNASSVFKAMDDWAEIKNKELKEIVIQLQKDFVLKLEEVKKQHGIEILKWLSEHQQDFSCEDILDNEALEDYYNQIITDLQSKQ